tara:strand:- start:294 stop:617 length:324 start_codon:yes stop_codon:yes gene_type:complete
MNSKVSKRISRQVVFLFIEWLKTLVSEEEAAKVNKNNVWQMAPKDNLTYRDMTAHLTVHSPKWIRKKIKTLVRQKPDTDIESITMEELECLIKIGSREVSQDHFTSS